MLQVLQFLSLRRNLNVVQLPLLVIAILMSTLLCYYHCHHCHHCRVSTRNDFLRILRKTICNEDCAI